MSRVAIFTHRRAQEVDGVIDLLRARGAEVTRVNWCAYPGEAEYSVTHGDLASLQQASVAWLHEPYLFGVGRTLTGVARDVALRECAAFWDGVLEGLTCSWLNAPAMARRASHKVLQLKLASASGIPVPEYLVTNDAARARAFVSEQPSCVVKSLSAGYTEYGDQRLKAYTRRIGLTDEALFEGLESGPAIFQAEVSKISEIRTTFVDGECFSVAFDARATPVEVVDMRQLDYEGNIQRFVRATDVKHIEAWSRDLAGALGLSYACLDWVRDASGRDLFLECNPLGSFKWSELRGAWPITAAIASALLQRATS